MLKDSDQEVQILKNKVNDHIAPVFMDMVIQSSSNNWKKAFQVLGKDFLDMRDDEIVKDMREIEEAQNHTSDYSNTALIL